MKINRFFWVFLAFVGAWNAYSAPPNVLLIMGDDHAPYVYGAYAYGAYGNGVVRTPNLDRLASEGMRFVRAYCNSPVCTASRQSLLTGRYPRTVGVTQLRTALPSHETTMAEWFRQAGYDTGAIGKMHFNSNLSHGFQVRIDRPEHNAYLKQKGVTPIPEGIEVLGPWRPFQVHAREWLNGSYLPYGAVDEDMDAHFLAERASEYITTKRETPFFLVVSFYQPHSPFNFPVEYRGRHDPAKFDPPEPGPEDDWQIPKIFRDLTREEKQNITAAYYTAVEYLDAKIGAVLDALDRSGEADDTIVVYVGDHGYFLGHHGRFEKHAMFEEAVRAPLVVRYPGQVEAGSTTEALVEFIDIFPTLTDYCDLDDPHDIQGKSLEPVLSGAAETHREQVVVEYSENEEAMIRDERWKLIYGTGKRHRQDGYETLDPTPGRTVLLFDTQTDPSEHHNLADDPAHEERMTKMLSQLADHMRDTARRREGIPETEDVYEVLDYCLVPRDIGEN